MNPAGRDQSPLFPKMTQEDMDRAADKLLKAAIQRERQRIVACVRAATATIRHERQRKPEIVSAYRMGYEHAKKDILALFDLDVSLDAVAKEPPTPPAPDEQRVKKGLDEYRKAVVAYLRRLADYVEEWNFLKDVSKHIPHTLRLAADEINGNLLPRNPEPPEPTVI